MDTTDRTELMISGDIIKAPPAVPIDLCVIGRQINVLAILCK